MECVFSPEGSRCRALALPLEPLVVVLSSEPQSPPAPGVRLEVARTELFEWATRLGRPWTYRLGPLVPYLDDDLCLLEEQLERACEHGCDHVVVELAREAHLEGVPPPILRKIRAGLEEPGPSRDYRHRLFGLLRGLCDRLKVTFTALDPEFLYLCNRTPCCRALELTP